MDLSGLEFVSLAATSGALAGVANQAARFGHDWLTRRAQRQQQSRELQHQEAMQARELQHQRELQQEERDHQAEIRREAAFFEARKELLPFAVGAHAWVGWAWGEDFGPEVDYYPLNLNKPSTQSPADAMTALNMVATAHPSKTVRIYARELVDSIDAVVNVPDSIGNVDPGVEDYSNWLLRTQELIDALHDPTYEPQKVPMERRPPGP